MLGANHRNQDKIAIHFAVFRPIIVAMNKNDEAATGCYFVLLDTCTASNIFNKRWTPIEYDAFKSSMGFDTRITISDLSFSEMALGRKDLESFNALVKDLLDCEFMIVGQDEKLKRLIDKNEDRYVYSKVDMEAFQTKIKENVDRIHAKMFSFVARDYCLLFFLVLENIDKPFFGGARNTFCYLSNKGIIDRLADIYFVNHKNRKDGNLLFDIATNFLKMILANFKTSKEIDQKMVDLGLPGSLSRQTNVFINLF